MKNIKYTILSYYCYTYINDPENFRFKHHLYCLQQNLKGRIIIAKEGINGTLSGLTTDCKQYLYNLRSDQRFSKLNYKAEQYHMHCFQKLHVRVKKEIVYANLPSIHLGKKTGTYLSPSAFKKMKDQKDVVLLDARSSYEHKIGKFKNAVTLDIDCFREFPKKIQNLTNYKEKKIITYCTGGIKCEKASAYLIEQGFKNVYQLHGGIIRYGLETDGADFEGKCYVFDNRLTTRINKKNATVIGKCHVCKIACDRMINCANPRCNIHIPLCAACAQKMLGACSLTCQQHPLKRVYNGTGYYLKKINGYSPYKALYKQQKLIKDSC